MRNSKRSLSTPKSYCRTEPFLQRYEIKRINDDFPRRIRSQPTGLNYRIRHSDSMSKDDMLPWPTAETTHLLEKRFLAFHGLLERIPDIVFGIVATLAEKAPSLLVEANAPSL